MKMLNSTNNDKCFDNKPAVPPLEWLHSKRSLLCHPWSGCTLNEACCATPGVAAH